MPRKPRDKEKGAAYTRKYYKANRVTILTKRKEWALAHPEEHAARQALKIERFSEYQREYKQKYKYRRRRDVPWIALIRSAKDRAKKRGLPFELTNAWGQERWTGKCEWTNLPYDMSIGRSGPRAMGPSIDRIRPELGYVPDNCRFILHAVNAMKGDADDEVVLRIAQAIIANADD